MVMVPSPMMVEGSCFGALAIVASAGGIPALIQLLGGLGKAFPLPIFVAEHLPRIESALDQVLTWALPFACGVGQSW
jgi:chemotaxis response regulator CheB